MKFLHVVNEGLSGGVMRVAVEESRHLNRLGCKSYVMTLFNVYMHPNFVRNSELFYIFKNPLPKNLQHLVNPLLREFFGMSVNKIPMFVKCFRPDWIIIHNLSAFPFAAAAKNETKSRIALYVHNPTQMPSLKNLVRHKGISKQSALKQINKISSQLDVVLTSSNKMRHFIKECYNLDAYVVPPGCNPCRLNDLFLNKLDVVLVPQRISLGKGILDIAETLKKFDLPILFCGSSHYSTPIVLKKLYKMNLKKCYVMLDINDFELMRLYRKSLFTFSIIEEPFGMSIVESASQGTAMIAPKGAGASELFQHGVHGFFFKNINEAKKYIQILVNDKELAAKMGISGWEICREKYTWSDHTKSLIISLDKAI